ncbi:thioesterase II family protein [Rhizohabitans arisaemae]|uniref:thioesterase II family protein n=1 Tax=Rhizohabitans arisaemae TaxID=2720610 RepID=UPI0024B0EE09|nr:thioesterase domain-containing protein [Rhizohabitans arisaemae]
MKARWLVSWRPEPYGRPVVLCLPQAGAGCGWFRSWQHRLGDRLSVIGVQLPGRENRWADPPPESVEAVVEAVTGELVDAMPPGHPFLVFGNSFGGLIGYEITRSLGLRYGRWPLAFVVAACRPPDSWAGAGRGLVEGEEELAGLLDARGLGADDLDEDSREIALEILRQDARLSLDYELRGEPALPCPVEAWGGETDETVTAAQLDGWAGYAAGGFRRRRFPGGHHFAVEHAEALLPLLAGLGDPEPASESVPGPSGPPPAVRAPSANPSHRAAAR